MPYHSKVGGFQAEFQLFSSQIKVSLSARVLIRGSTEAQSRKHISGTTIVATEDTASRGSVTHTQTFRHGSFSTDFQTQRTMAMMLLTASYVFDWVVLIVFAAIGFVVGNLAPSRRPFHLDDPTIDFPYKGYDTVSVPVLFIVSIAAPLAIIFVVALVFASGPTGGNKVPKKSVWRSRLWEWHAGWLGLGLSVVTAWFVTSGIKNFLGKPRPNALNRCQPDFSNVAKYYVGQVSGQLSNSRPVSADICMNPDKSVIDEGFRSFPSGHSSISASGLVYLSLVLAIKLNVAAQLRVQGSNDNNRPTLGASSSLHEHPDGHYGVSNAVPSISRREYEEIGRDDCGSSSRSQAAATPLYLLVLALLPVGTAIFISASRWHDFQHHGFDIIVGFFIGTITSVLAFRYYYLPMGRGSGRAWAARSTKGAFWTGASIGARVIGGRRIDTEAQLPHPERDEGLDVEGGHNSYPLHAR